jgi:hypothetical protein
MNKLFHSTFYVRSLIVIVILFNAGVTLGQVSPVAVPKGGFKIDGALRANVTTAAGDWVPRLNSQTFTAGVDSFVLDAAGNPENAVSTRHQTDLYNSGSDDVFTQGSKFTDYISALHWGLSTAPNKNDIHNGVFHASGDASGNQWVFIGGDRLDVAGTSYIDFEFLQGTITTNASTFTGSGLAGGRTIGDINISMEYNNGGSAPKVVIYRWAPTSEAGTAWTWDSTGSAAITDAYAKTNLVAVDVPFGAFGATTYQAFAFVEAAINVTQLVSLAGGGNCAGLSIKTLWIKTKASSSSTAALKDFMTPISLDLTFGGVSINAAGPFCVSASAVQLTGSPSGGTFSGPGTSSSGLFTPSTAGVGTHTVVYTATAGVNCTKTASAQIEVRALPTAAITGTTTLCQDATSPFVVFTGSGGTRPYTFSYTLNGGSTLTKTTTGTFDTARIAVPTGTPGTFTYALTGVSDANCSNSASGSAIVTVNPKPSASISGTTTVCKDATSPFVVFTGSGGTRPYTFSYTFNGGGTLTKTTTGSFDTARIAVPTGSQGTFTYVLTGVSDANCSNVASGTAIVTVNAKPSASISGATTVCKDGTAPFVVFTGSGGTRPYTFNYTINGAGAFTRTTTGSFDTARVSVPTGTPGTFTYALTGVSDANCSNTASGSAAVVVNTVPTAPLICVVQPSLCNATGIVKVTSPLVAGYQYSKDDGATWQNCNVFLNIAAGSNPIIRYKTDIGCVSASTTTCNAPVCSEVPANCAGGNFARVGQQETASIEEAPLKVKAYPNPFNDKVKFVVTSPANGDGTLEVFNMMGQKVKSIYSGHFIAGSQTFELSLPANQVAMLVYVLRVGGKQVTGKLIQKD